MIRYAIFILVITGLVFNCSNKSSSAVNQKSILGAWEVNKIEWLTADTTFVIEKVQAGYLMVLPKRYTFMWTPTKTARVAFKKLAYPTDEEILSGFRSIVFNAGTYNITDSIFKLEANIAKVPGFEGGTQSFVYNIVGDTLKFKMIDETYPNGEKPDWYGKVETRFTLFRLKE